MKLKDEILNILSDTLYIGRDAETEVPVIHGESNASRRLKEMVERYCKRQRELCAYAVDENYDLMVLQDRAEICGCISRTKLATEE